MKKYLLPNDVNWYRANMHNHTTFSDGHMTPEEIKEAYMNHGYSIVAYTDHEILLDHSELSDENFLAITSSEYSITERESSFKPISVPAMSGDDVFSDTIAFSVLNTIYLLQ